MLNVPGLLGIQNNAEQTQQKRMSMTSMGSMSLRPSIANLRNSRQNSVFGAQKATGSIMKLNALAGDTDKSKVVGFTASGVPLPPVYEFNPYSARLEKEIKRLTAVAATPAQSIAIQIQTHVRALSEIALLVYSGGPPIESIIYYEQKDLFDHMAGLLNKSEEHPAIRLVSHSFNLKQVIQTFHSICYCSPILTDAINSMDAGIAMVSVILDQNADLELKYWSIATLFILAARVFTSCLNDPDLRTKIEEYSADAPSWLKWGKNEAKDLLTFM